jgi:4-hydroxybenzoate polyprenyltransferase
MGLVGQTKDLSDAEGDEEAGRRSGPVAWGERAARLAYSVAALLLGVAYVLAAALVATDLLDSAIAVAVGAAVVAALLLGPWGKGDRSRRRRPYRAFMLTQYGAHLAVFV